MMNDKIIANGKQGVMRTSIQGFKVDLCHQVYDGCKEAVRLAHELAGYKGSSE